jgi:hypothetical protein
VTTAKAAENGGETTMCRNLYRETAHIVATALDDTSDEPAACEAIAKVARKLADAFKTDNPIFRYDKFFGACGLDPWGEVMPNHLFDNGLDDLR